MGFSLTSRNYLYCTYWQNYKVNFIILSGIVICWVHCVKEETEKVLFVITFYDLKINCNWVKGPWNFNGQPAHYCILPFCKVNLDQS
jgi:hypothetical protein